MNHSTKPGQFISKWVFFSPPYFYWQTIQPLKEHEEKKKKNGGHERFSIGFCIFELLVPVISNLSSAKQCFDLFFFFSMSLHGLHTVSTWLLYHYFTTKYLTDTLPVWLPVCPLLFSGYVLPKHSPADTMWDLSLLVHAGQNGLWNTVYQNICLLTHVVQKKYVARHLKLIVFIQCSCERLNSIKKVLKGQANYFYSVGKSYVVSSSSVIGATKTVCVHIIQLSVSNQQSTNS